MMLAMVAVVFSPFVEQHRWPFTTTTTTNQIPLSHNVPKEIVAAFDSVAAPQLGKPGEIKPAISFAYAVHERATSLWFVPDITSIFLPTASGDKPVKYLPNSAIWKGNEGGKNYFDDETARKLTGTPKDKYPPLGGLARLWELDKNRWDWIGYREFEYHYGPNKVFFQRFERGLKIGPLPAGNKSNQAEVLVIPDANNDFHWFARIVYGLRVPTPDWRAPGS